MGPTPLGYDVVDPEPAGNGPEAATVRRIYRRYLDLGSVRELAVDLARSGVTSTVQHWRNGCTRGGAPLGSGTLYQPLWRRLYRGEIVYGGQAYPGQHEANISVELSDAVQALLVGNGIARQAGPNARYPSLLAGMINDGRGTRMTPGHAARGSRRYRCYVVLTGKNMSDSTPTMRIAAGDIKRALFDGAATLLRDEDGLFACLDIRLAMLLPWSA